MKKDPGIPNLFPYKDKILAEVEEKRRLKAEETERRKEEIRALKNGKTTSEVANGAPVEAEDDGDALLDYDGSDDDERMEEVSLMVKPKCFDAYDSHRMRAIQWLHY